MTKIIQKENRVLRQVAKEVPLRKIRSTEIKTILKKMGMALGESKNGVAIAAPQIGESLQIFIIDKNSLLSQHQMSVEKPTPSVGSKKIDPWIFINPVIKKISKKIQTVSEGCLSVRGVYGVIQRAEKTTVEAYDENGKKFSRGASGLLAQIIQHEIDHLNGILFIDKAKTLEKYGEN